ncbi:MAG: hypothetical protein RLO50_14485 [Azospirillaceae bacterium]
MRNTTIDRASIATRCAETFARRPDLRAEFGEVATFVAFETAVALGRTPGPSLLDSAPPAPKQPAAPYDPQTTEQHAAERWRADPALRREFGNDEDAWKAFAHADAQGLARPWEERA